MYDPQSVFQQMDSHAVTIVACLAGAVLFSFVYFTIAVRMALRQQVYVVPFVGAAVFFWHDLSYVLNYQEWFHVYNHWWVKLWWYALVGTTAFEAFLIYQVIRYGHREFLPGVSRGAFAGLVVLATLGSGALWAITKASLDDPLYLLTFAITAVWSVPFHTGLMIRRQSIAGQSIAMEASVLAIFAFDTAALMQMAPVFRSPAYLAFFAAFMIWPAANIWLILKLSKTRLCKRFERAVRVTRADARLVKGASGAACRSKDERRKPIDFGVTA